MKSIFFLAFALAAIQLLSVEAGNSTNPFLNRYVFRSPYYAAEVNASLSKISDPSLRDKAAKVAKIPTFTWLDTASKVPLFGKYLASAQKKQKTYGKKYLVQIVVYDLPNRDCHAKASNGELNIKTGGVEKYKKYIDSIAALAKRYSDVSVVAVVEPDSLANLVTNLNDPRCAEAAPAYRECTIYAIQKLSQANVNLYLDAGHGGWLGWDANLPLAAQLFGDLLRQAGEGHKVRGLATNIANYNPLVADSPDPVTVPNKNWDELKYVTALAPLLTQQNFPAHFIIDQARSGKQRLRLAWGDWCNIKGAGFGLRPSTKTPSPLIDSIVWVKPGGESDGTSDTSSPRYDSTCSLGDAAVPAPEAGEWFQSFFETLVMNANPPL